MTSACKINCCFILQLDADNFEKEGKLAEIREERGYLYSDCITCTPERLPNYEQKVGVFSGG